MCRYAPGAGDVDMVPSPEGDASLLSRDSISMESSVPGPRGKVRLKVQFTPPCLVRYFTPAMEVSFSLAPPPGLNSFFPIIQGKYAVSV